MPSPIVPNFNLLARQFTFEGRFLEACPFGNGHIHDTYALSFAIGNGKIHRYILQKMNTRIFTQPVLVMENIAKVTAYLRQAILAAGGDPLRETLTLIPAQDGRLYYQDEESATWRAMIFIEGAQTYQVVSDLHLYTHAARAFGRFQLHLADFPAAELHVTLPRFHDTPWRLENSHRAV